MGSEMCIRDRWYSRVNLDLEEPAVEYFTVTQSETFSDPFLGATRFEIDSPSVCEDSSDVESSVSLSPC